MEQDLHIVTLFGVLMDRLVSALSIAFCSFLQSSTARNKAVNTGCSSTSFCKANIQTHNLLANVKHNYTAQGLSLVNSIIQSPSINLTLCCCCPVGFDVNLVKSLDYINRDIHVLDLRFIYPYVDTAYYMVDWQYWSVDQQTKNLMFKSIIESKR